MTRDELAAKTLETAEQLHDKVRAAIDFDNAGKAADWASALKDTAIAQRELDDGEPA